MKDKIKKYMLVEIGVIIALLVLDFATKKYAEAYLYGEHFNLIPYLFNVTYHQNRGAAFGILQDNMLFFYIITAVAVPGFCYYMYRTRQEKLLHKVALAMIVAGALGNAVDRIFYGYVIDWIDFAFMDFPIFNIADSALSVGAVLLIIYYLFVYKEPQKATHTQQNGILQDFVSGDLQSQSMADKDKEQSAKQNTEKEVLQNTKNSNASSQSAAHADTDGADSSLGADNRGQ